MSSTALYTDLSNYYDLMCADINYQAQSNCIRRLHQIFGNKGVQYLDLACGTGPHIKHFIDYGYQASGLDINQPMLDIAQKRCPDALFSMQDMSNFQTVKQLDLITCFLYSIHYNNDLQTLNACIENVYNRLNSGGVFCFNAVDKTTIDNRAGIKHTLMYENAYFSFQSNWYYSGAGDRQLLQLKIEKTIESHTENWQDQHNMVAISFQHLQALLLPYFELHIFEHNFEQIIPWEGSSGNAIFVCVKP